MALSCIGRSLFSSFKQALLMYNFSLRHRIFRTLQCSFMLRLTDYSLRKNVYSHRTETSR